MDTAGKMGYDYPGDVTDYPQEMLVGLTRMLICHRGRMPVISKFIFPRMTETEKSRRLFLL